MSPEFTPLASTVGGILIGLAAGFLYLNGGRMAGISSILGAGLRFDGAEAGWRWIFMGGLAVGGLLLAFVHPGAFPAAIETPLGWLAAGGLLVGAGSRMGGGCTSGHGVCGLSRMSRRSLAATLTFMAAGVGIVFLANHVFAGGAS